MPRTTHALLVAVALAALACVGPRTSSAPAETLHPAYRPMLAAVQDALDREQLFLAERTLLAWRSRLTVDAAFAARAVEGVPAQAGRPDAASVATATRTVESYERIVAGRVALAGLDIALELRRVAGAERVQAVLTARSRLDADVELRPGPASLEVRRQSLEPRTGHETTDIEVQQLADGLRLVVPAGGAAEVGLTELAILVPGGAIATRMRCRATLLGGALVLGGRELPARAWPVAAAERTDLPGWLPATPVEPEELARLAAEAGATPEALAERAVRILPTQRVAALELLREPVALRTVEELTVLMPALRWLCGVEGLGRDPYAWRKYMAEARWRDAAPGG